MLHLFNKVYLEFDDKIEINFDRVVISTVYGNKMYDALDKVSYGELLMYGKTYDEVIKDSFIDFITVLKDHGNTSDKRIIIYCDKTSYKKLIARWFTLIFPNLDLESFKILVDFTIYNQRITSNTQLSSIHSVDLNATWLSLDDISLDFNSVPNLTEKEKTEFNRLNLKLSYEFLIANYLGGGTEYKEELRSTVQFFLLRWFKEMLTDNRQMVLLNLTNHQFQTSLNIDPTSINITQLDPLSSIPKFKYYADNEIWERNENMYGICNLSGLSTDKLNGLINTIATVYQEFEGMKIDTSNFKIANWIHYVASEYLTDEQLGEILEFLVQTPFDTSGVPRFDFQNVNFPLFQYFLAEKYNERDLSKYRLL